MRLDRFDAAAFLRDTWQRRPLLIRDPWDGWTNPLDPDEFAGLACEDEVEARLILRSRRRWQVEHGPFAQTRFAGLAGACWTMLIQAADHHVPDVAALIDAFRFVPDWRIDDVMVSYATDGAGVGPHFDQYDVFLVQGLGRRRWRIGRHCDAAAACLPHDELRLLADFRPEAEWVLEPGDILYVPPGFAHDGVAVGDDCMTYSIGFRAPARSELIAHWCDHVLAELGEDDRYADPGLAAQANPGEIAPGALDRLHAMVAERLLDRDGFARWFGAYTSTPKYPEMDWSPDAPLTEDDLRRGATLLRNPASRFSFIRQAAGNVLLFVDGASFDCAGPAAGFAEAICRENGVAIDAAWLACPATRRIILTLGNQGSLALDDGA